MVAERFHGRADPLQKKAPWLSQVSRPCPALPNAASATHLSEDLPLSPAVTTYAALVIAVVLEIIATSLLKASEQFTRLWPTVASIASYAAAFVLLAKSIQRGMQVGVAYAVWSGLGTTVIVVIGALFLSEPVTALKVLGVALVIAGVVVLNLGGAH